MIFNFRNLQTRTFLHKTYDFTHEAHINQIECCQLKVWMNRDSYKVNLLSAHVSDFRDFLLCIGAASGDDILESLAFASSRVFLSSSWSKAENFKVLLTILFPLIKNFYNKLYRQHFFSEPCIHFIQNNKCTYKWRECFDDMSHEFHIKGMSVG